jgi:hypothetical protein
MSRLLTDWLSAYEEYVENSEPPKLYHVWTALAVLAGALQRRSYLDWGFTKIFPNLYVVLVGPSGKCRKGTAIDIGLKLLRTLNIHLAAESLTREALIRSLAETQQDYLNPTTQTTEGHCSLTIMAEEFGVFLGVQQHQIMQDLCDLYDSRDLWEYRTKTSGTDTLNGVCLNMEAATTPEYLQNALPHEALGVGLASRIIFVSEEEKSKSLALPFLTREQIRLQDLLTKDLEKIHLISGEFHVKDEVKELYKEWYDNPKEDPGVDDERFNGYNARRPTHLRKLWMLSSASRCGERVINEWDFERSLFVLRETEKKMSRAFGALGINKLAPIMERVYSMLLRRGSVRHSELCNAFFRDANPTDMKIILMALRERRLIAIETCPIYKEPLYKPSTEK